MTYSTVKLESTFELSIRNAFVLSIHIISGEVKAGTFLVDWDNNRSIEINSVEYVDLPGGKSSIGLLFKDKSSSDLGYLKQLKENDFLHIAHNNVLIS